MAHRSYHLGCSIAVALALVCMAGCVERRMVIITEPYGAVVYDEKNQPIGAAPVDRTFTFYGKYRFRLAKDGYETRIVEEQVNSPWYEVFPLDFVSENLIPFTLRDVRYFRYELIPLQIASPEKVRDDAEILRQKGRGIGTPLPPTPEPTQLQGIIPQPPPVPPGMPPA